MKRNLFLIMIFIAITVLFSGVKGVFAQQYPMPGGYQKISPTDKQSLLAAKFAVKAEQQRLGTRIQFIGVESAETQVVAGTNYKLCLKVKIKGRLQTATAVVFMNLKQKYSLISWRKGDCSIE